MKIGILAGEASGDQLGAQLMLAIRQQCPNARFEGIGGIQMQQAGCHSLFDIERLSVMGFIEPLKRLPDLIKLRKDLKQHFLQNRPDVFIGIDAPDFNLGLELQLRKAGIPVVQYVSPSVWAWRQYRVRKIAKAVDLMLTLFPFEADFYKQHNVPVTYVGHPLADSIPLEINVDQSKKLLGLNPELKYIALFSGSRKQEAQYLLEPYILAAKILWQQFPELHFVTSQVNDMRYQEFVDACKRLAPEMPVHVFLQRSHDVMAASDMMVVTSGTATLEAMLYKKPMVIAYRMPGWLYRIAKWLVKTPYVGLPNILAKESIVPELIQDDADPEAIARQMVFYMTHSEETGQLVQRFHKLHQSLRCDAAKRAADAILNLVKV